MGVMLVLLANQYERSQRRKEMKDDFSKGFNKALAWLLIATMFVIVIRLLSGCARPAQLYRPVPYVPLMALDSASSNDGETRCDLLGNPVVYIKVREDSVFTKMVMLHEGIHVRQIFAFGSCFGFMDKIKRDGFFRFQMEAEAYCAVYDEETLRGFPHVWTLKDLQNFLEMSTGVHDTKIPCGGDDARQRPRQSPTSGSGGDSLQARPP
jgi:hypothetical protein